ncbi:phage tail protein [Pectobacterium parmentieri]|uniref:tail fiber protein n=1 Tax=Pectobacterium parmentieri TaxID=1905730 RepID=UPI0001B0F938|nr:Tail Collar domain protein [Pectobacterium parmentieri WPP163]AYH00787.1 phage tail protein [Pectobacterium parmentieri]AYH27024.1 phage tail protein [Pectobacterium parmentieri]AYH31473.1 phage tail protein [Pectobacterium parmentieri]MBI0516553.1 phage tail protein [Pectobacterium parmentieri]
MANLSEQESWIDGIYQLETSDPVVAGPGGISNRQAEQLASRTAYLKKMQETTGDSLQKHLAASDPHSQYAPKNSPALTGTPTAPTTAQTANNTQIATTAFVKSAIAALINGSPAALDTLQELANALGNDPHFSTTILNAITDVKTDATNKLNAHASILDAHPQYAPKASPAFTGTPTAPTAASSSNDTQLATTAFVKAAVAALVNGSPTALDTLQELANALGNDPNFSTTILNALAGKLAKDQNGADIPDKSRFRQNVGLGDVWNNQNLPGPFGASINSGIIHDCDLIAPGTTALCSGTAKNGPGFYAIVFSAYGHTNQYVIQVARAYGGAEFATRARNGDVNQWTEWSRSWTLSNLNPMTTDTEQTITGGKTIRRNNEALLLKPQDIGLGSYILARDADDSDRWYLGYSSANVKDLTLHNYASRSSIILQQAGDCAVHATRLKINEHEVWHKGSLTPAAIGAMPSAELVGMPQVFPGAVAPAGWLKCNGQQFDTAQYPILASRYPSGFLPDLRGEFVRGWDDERGVDAGRALLSEQGDAIRNITGTMRASDVPYGHTQFVDALKADGVFAPIAGDKSWTGDSSGNAGNPWGVSFDTSRVVPTANENRPRNIAFNYIVRAA